MKPHSAEHFVLGAPQKDLIGWEEGGRRTGVWVQPVCTCAGFRVPDDDDHTFPLDFPLVYQFRPSHRRPRSAFRGRFTRACSPPPFPSRQKPSNRGRLHVLAKTPRARASRPSDRSRRRCSRPKRRGATATGPQRPADAFLIWTPASRRRRGRPPSIRSLFRRNIVRREGKNIVLCQRKPERTDNVHIIIIIIFNCTAHAKMYVYTRRTVLCARASVWQGKQRARSTEKM